MRELDYFEQLNQTARQQNFLEKISESREYQDNSILNSYRAIYIPSYSEMSELLSKVSIYRMLFTPDQRTFAPGKLLIPGFSPLGHLVTFAMYDPVARLEAQTTGVYGKSYYFYPDVSTGFKKSNFLLMPYEMWKVAFETKRITVSDGVFDAGAVSQCGIPCAANLGTTLGEGVKKILSLFEEVTLFKDTDAAGTELYQDMSKNLKNLRMVEIPHTVGKDIDKYLVKMGKEALLKAISPTGKVNLGGRRMGAL